MTLLEAIARVDALAPNTISQGEKLRWLSQLDSLVCQTLKAHEGEVPSWTPYTPQTPGDTRLLMEEPYAEGYIHWLKAWVHYYQGETALYNESNLLFAAAWREYQNHINRTKMPLGRKRKYW